MAQSATLTALGEIVQEIRGKGHFGNCQKNSQEYVDWCSWILGTRERLLAFGAKLSLSTNEAIKGVDFDWDDWISVSAAIERIHAIAYLVEDDVRMAGQEAGASNSLRRFETTRHSYEKKHSLGNGGAGNVFLVERDDGESFALKILNSQSCANGKKMKRFLREMAFCERVTDAPLVKVVDQGFKQEGELKRPFYVMPLYDNSLRKLMESPKIERASILRMLLALLSSLEGFYNDGHVHRDIKPENILFDKDANRLVLADFGVAHINQDLPGLTLQTTRAERLANFKYAAPEQRIADGVIDHRADQYAFGLIINELFTGAVPQGTGYAEIAGASERFSYLDPIVARMISQNQDSRYEGIPILLADIEARKNIEKIEDEVLEFEACVPEPFEISIVSKEWIEPNLVFKLNMSPGADWEQAFRSYMGVTSFSTDGFFLDPQRFTVNGDKILVPNTHGDRGHLADACKEMPRFIDWANEVMRKRLEKERRETHEALVRAREDEIRRQESSADINSFLSTL